MYHRHMLALSSAALLFAAACSPPSDSAESTPGATGSAAGTLAEPTLTEARAAIDATNQKAVAAMLAGDAVTASAHYADDAVVMMPGMTRMNGHAEIEAGFKGMMESMKVNAAQFTTNDVTLGGDLAVETGTFSMTTTMKNAKPTTEQGEYLTVWKRQTDGSWKIIRDINNADPVATPAK